jgi:hypothetical protein
MTRISVSAVYACPRCNPILFKAKGGDHMEPETETLTDLVDRVVQQDVLRPYRIFIAVHRSPIVMRGAEFVARACSHTMAKRIANALNKHTPNERGE